MRPANPKNSVAIRCPFYPSCKKTFGRPSSLWRHLDKAQAHNLPSIPCDFSGCEESFYTEREMQKSWAKHHGMVHPELPPPKPKEDRPRSSAKATRQRVESAPSAAVEQEPQARFIPWMPEVDLLARKPTTSARGGPRSQRTKHQARKGNDGDIVGSSTPPRLVSSEDASRVTTEFIMKHIGPILPHNPISLSDDEPLKTMLENFDWNTLTMDGAEHPPNAVSGGGTPLLSHDDSSWEPEAQFPIARRGLDMYGGPPHYLESQHTGSNGAAAGGIAGPAGAIDGGFATHQNVDAYGSIRYPNVLSLSPYATSGVPAAFFNASQSLYDVSGMSGSIPDYLASFQAGVGGPSKSFGQQFLTGPEEITGHPFTGGANGWNANHLFSGAPLGAPTMSAADAYHHHAAPGPTNIFDPYSSLLALPSSMPNPDMYVEPKLDFTIPPRSTTPNDPHAYSLEHLVPRRFDNVEIQWGPQQMPGGNVDFVNNVGGAYGWN